MKIGTNKRLILKMIMTQLKLLEIQRGKINWKIVFTQEISKAKGTGLDGHLLDKVM